MKNSVIIAIILMLLNMQPSFAYDQEAIKLYNKGIDLCKSEKYEKAISNFHKAVNIDPGFLDAYYNLAVIQRYLGNTNKALDSFEKIYNKNKNDYEVILEIARLYYEKKSFDNAEEYISHIPEEHVKYAEAQELVQLISKKKNNIKEAKAEKENLKQVSAKKEEKEKLSFEDEDMSPNNKIPAEKEDKKITKLSSREYSAKSETVHKSESGEVTVNKTETKMKQEQTAQKTTVKKEDKSSKQEQVNEKVAVADNKDAAKKVEVKQSETGSQFASTISGFDGPTGMVKDSNGNLYVANYSDNSVIQITPAGYKRVVAKGEPLAGPLGMAIDVRDNIYVANYNSNQIVKIPIKGQIPEVMPFNVSQPYFIMLDNAGNMFVSEQGNNIVSKFSIY